MFQDQRIEALGRRLQNLPLPRQRATFVGMPQGRMRDAATLSHTSRLT